MFDTGHQNLCQPVPDTCFKKKFQFDSFAENSAELCVNEIVNVFIIPNISSSYGRKLIII